MSVDVGVFGWARRALRPTRYPPGPEHRSMFVVDIAGFGRWHDLAQLRARQVLTGAVRSAFRAAGVRWADLVVLDRGDGMVVLVPAWVSKIDLLNPVVPDVARILQRHNRTVADAERIRVRVSVHAGEVQRDPHGWCGCDLNLACRLVDSEPARDHLRRSSAQVVLVVSELIYQGVVRHGHREVDPAAYLPIDVLLKEVDARAWLHVVC
jgi:hypothetical protein